MLSILFFVKRRKPLKDGSVPIFMRVSSHQEYVECSLRRSTMPSQWVTAKGRVRNNTLVNKQLNEYLDQQEFRIYDIERGLLAEGKQVSVQEVMRQYRGVEQPEGEMLCKLYEEHNSRMKELIGKTTAANTYKRHLTSLKLFREFLTATRGVSDIEVKALDAQLMEEYQHYLMTVRSNNNNTTVKYLRNLSKVVNLAKTRGLIQTNPIDLLPLKMQTVEREFLTQDELKRLEEKQIGISRLEQVRDIFLFCCLTGLAYVDVASLSMENIVEGKRGRQWLRKARNKTNNMCNIPLLRPALRILEKYAEYRAATGRLLPVPSNQKMNAYLKELATLCGITKNLTTHCARHTFATTVTLANGASLENVSKMLGHSSVRMTQHYAKILNSSIERDMDKIESELIGEDE